MDKRSNNMYVNEPQLFLTCVRPSINCEVKSRIYCRSLNTYDFDLKTLPHAKLPLHWPVINCQRTFE